MMKAFLIYWVGWKNNPYNFLFLTFKLLIHKWNQLHLFNGVSNTLTIGPSPS